MNCKICYSEKLEIIYNGFIRAGAYPLKSKKKYKVLSCKNCDFSFLDSEVKIDYIGRGYRIDYNSSSKLKTYSELHNPIQKSFFNKIGKKHFNRKVVLDSGCAGGDLLDIIKDISTRTIGIEPSLHFHKNLEKKGHLVFSDAKKLIKKKLKTDIITSYGVIEHTKDPIKYLMELNKILKKNGRIYIATENTSEILLKMKIKKFNSFFYRTAHLSYFNKKSLNLALKKTGFKSIKCKFWQQHDLSNTLNWIKNSKPTGNNNLMNISDEINSLWKSFLEKNSLAEIIIFSAQKK